MTKTERIRVADIIVISKNHRGLIAAKVELLASSMAEIGLKTSIVVNQGKNGPILVAGQHRLEAAKLLGWSSHRLLSDER